MLKVPPKALFIIPIGLIAISFSSILIKLCSATVLVIAVYRLTLASLFFIGINTIKKQSLLIFSRRQTWLAITSGIFLALHFVTWIASLQYTSVASSVVLVQTAPIFVALGAFFFLKEKISWLLLIGIILTICGGTILGLIDATVNKMSIQGDLLAIAGAFGASGYILIGRFLRANIDTVRYVVAVYSVTAFILLLLVLFTGTRLYGFSYQTYLLLLAMAIGPQIIGHTSINWILEYFSAATVSVIILAEPIGASILAYFLLGESVSLAKIAGGIVIIIGVFITLQSESREYQRQKNR